MPGRVHPVGIASLVAAVERTLAAPQPITIYGCDHFTPKRDIGPREMCDICGGGKPLSDDVPPRIQSDAITCGGCHRASHRVETDCDRQLRAVAKAKAAKLRNHDLTRGTPTPAVLLDESA